MVFPHAGAAAVSYRKLATALAAGGDTYIVQYPQRADRLANPPRHRARSRPRLVRGRAVAAGGAAAAVRAQHGRGRRIRVRQDRRIPRCRGAAAVGVGGVRRRAAVAGMPELPTSDDGLLADIADLGGTDPELLADEEFAELLITAIRADYQAINRYTCDPDVRIRADIYALGAPRRPPRRRRGYCGCGKSTPRARSTCPVRRRTLLPQRPHRRRRRAGECRWLTTDSTAAADPVVIVGMAVEAPGGIDTAEGYWELLSHGREALGPFPTDRGWAVRELLAGSRRSGFKEIHDRGGFLTGATTFDPEFFGISPREAVAMDPQQRVALRVSWRALENSGINPDDLAGHDVGCFVGASATGYGPADGRVLPSTAVICSPEPR